MMDALVGVPGGIACADDVEHRLAADPAVAVGALEAEEVRAAIVPVDRRPEEEDLRQRVLGRGRRRARRSGARPTTGPWCRGRVRERGSLPCPRRTIVPDHVPHCVMRVESMTVFVPAVSVWRGSSSATVRAVNVTSASMPRSAASQRTRVVRNGSTTSIDSGPIRVSPRSAGMRPDANTERCTPSCTTENAAVDDAAVRDTRPCPRRSNSPRCSR